MFGVPLAALLMAGLVWRLGRSAAAATPSSSDSSLTGQANPALALSAALVPMTRGERNVVFAFAFTVLLWVLPGAALLILGAESGSVKWLQLRLPESVAALLGAGWLFLLPASDHRGPAMTLEWRHAARIDWGTLILFGGGLSLGEMMFSTGLARWVGESLAGLFQVRTEFGLIVLFTATAIVVSETTSNAASATMIVPVAIAVSQAAGVPPLAPALAACLGASLGFMLPVSTPPNAIVYGSGKVRIQHMAREGLLLDLAGFVVIVAAAAWWIPVVIKAKL